MVNSRFEKEGKGNIKVMFSNTFYSPNVSSVSLISVVPPLDLAYCASVLRTSLERVDVNILDANALKLDIKSQTDQIISYCPDFLVFSAKTYSIPLVKKISEEVKTTSSNRPTIILIGTHGSALPKETLYEIKDIDFIIIGEPEQTLLELVKSFLKAGNKINQTSLEGINGLAYKDSKISSIKVNNKRPSLKELDSLPFPARDLLPNHLYSSPYSGRVTSIETNRGCPGSCTYCEMHNLYGKNIRSRSAGSVVKEIRLCVEELGVRYFAFSDHTFTSNSSFVNDLCKKLISSGLNNKIVWSCNTRLDKLSEDLIKNMKKAGCFQIGVGIESGSDKNLKIVKKGVDQALISGMVLKMKKAGIFVMGYAIIGFPWETEKDIRDTEEVLFSVNPHILQISFATPLPGSSLYGYCLKHSLLLSKDWGDFSFLKKSIIKNENISNEKLGVIRKKILSRFYLRPKKLITLTKVLLFNKSVNYISCLKSFFSVLSHLSRIK